MRSSRIDLADSALQAPQAGFGDEDFYPNRFDKAAILCWRLARNQALPDGNKGAAWAALTVFIDLPAGSALVPAALSCDNIGRMTNQSMNKYDRLMSVERVTVSLESELASAVREAADDDSLNISAWFADAARRRLASRGLRDVIAEWEAEHGTFSEQELDAAKSRLSQ